MVRHGQIEQRKDIVELFNDRMVTFLVGSSTSFEGLLPMKGFNPRFIGTVQDDAKILRFVNSKDAARVGGG